MIGKVGVFLRQVLAELRKVVWPTRSELVSATATVVVFAVAAAVLVAALDAAAQAGVGRLLSGG